jgi:hypothetical protein
MPIPATDADNTAFLDSCDAKRHRGRIFTKRLWFKTIVPRGNKGIELMSTPASWGNLRPAHIQHATEFLSSADSLRAIVSQNDVFHKPSLYLFAHSLELTIKSLSLWLGQSDEDLKGDGHRLVGPYNRAKSAEKSKPIIKNAESKVRENWKTKLRNDRSAYVSSFGDYAGVVGNETPTNADIGTNLPTLADAVAWMEPLHAVDGGAFRYANVSSLYSEPVIHCFGERTFVVPQSLAWGCREILKELAQKMRTA